MQGCLPPLLGSLTGHHNSTGIHSTSLWLVFLASVQQGGIYGTQFRNAQQHEYALSAYGSFWNMDASIFWTPAIVPMIFALEYDCFWTDCLIRLLRKKRQVAKTSSCKDKLQKQIYSKHSFRPQTLIAKVRMRMQSTCRYIFAANVQCGWRSQSKLIPGPRIRWT